MGEAGRTMNTFVPPSLLWPVPVFMALTAVLWWRWQTRAFEAAPAEDWPEHKPRGWRHHRLCPTLLAVVALVGFHTLWRFSAPCVYGRVIDARSGRPVAGAEVMRRIYRKGPPSLAETGTVFPEPFSAWTTRTDGQGRFFLPGWVSLLPTGIAGLSGLTWVVYRPGVMPARGCVSQCFLNPEGCSSEGPFWSPDPWEQHTVSLYPGLIHLVVDTYPPTLEGVTFRAFNAYGREVVVSPPTDADPWGEHFRRLEGLRIDGYLDRADVLTQACAYLDSRRPMTDTIATTFLAWVGAPVSGYPVPQDREPHVLKIRGALADFCQGRSGAKFCRTYSVGIGYIRESLHEGASHAK